MSTCKVRDLLSVLAIFLLSFVIFIMPSVSLAATAPGLDPCVQQTTTSEGPITYNLDKCGAGVSVFDVRDKFDSWCTNTIKGVFSPVGASGACTPTVESYTSGALPPPAGGGQSTGSGGGQSTGSGGGQSTGSGGGQGTGDGSSSLTNPLSGVNSINDLLVAILNVLIVLATPVIVIFIILAGFKYVTASGNAQKVEEAHKALTYAIIGGVLIIGALALSEIVSNLVNAFR